MDTVAKAWTSLLKVTRGFPLPRSNMVILKNVPRILSPQLLSVLARMGHGDEIGRYTDTAELMYVSRELVTSYF